MPPLPIRALTLYKQGIGYYQRRGTLTEPFATLVVARESLNDVLKSLDIVVHQGGPLLSVDYETPTDRTEQLAGLSMSLGKNTSLQDVIAGLCGTDVVVSTSAGEQITGRVVGLEGSMTETQPVVLVLQHADALRMLPLAVITDIALPDERAAADIQFLLDVGQPAPIKMPNARPVMGTHRLRCTASISMICDTYAALALLSGVDIFTLSRRLGHESINTTADKYGHLYRGRADDAQAIERLLKREADHAEQ